MKPALLIALLFTSAALAQAPFKITDFGAAGDGKTSNTEAIRKAIRACADAGGGRVEIPAGNYLTGPIELMSDVDLHIAHGATVIFSRNLNDYMKPDASLRISPISGDGLHDVSVTGDGVFDGQGEAWRPLKKAKVPDEFWKKMLASGGTLDTQANTWYPPRPIQNSDELEGLHDIQRPSLVSLTNCRKITLDGPTFRNSPGWNVHLELSEDITVRGVTCFNEEYAQNGDSLDVQSCRNIVISNCTLGGGDDVICLKSGKDESGRARGRPTENVFITNCVMGTGHGGIVIGSEMSGGVRNVTATNCVMKGTDAGLRFKTTRGRGGVVENINISNIEMSDIAGPAILFDMYYGQKSQGSAQPVDEGTPQFRQFHISNIRCTGAKTALALRGLPEMPLDQVYIEHSTIKAADAGYIIDAKEIVLRDVRIDAPAEVKVQSTTGLVAERVAGFPKSLPAAKE